MSREDLTNANQQMQHNMFFSQVAEVDDRQQTMTVEMAVILGAIISDTFLMGIANIHNDVIMPSPGKGAFATHLI